MNKLQQFNIMSFEYDRLKNADFNLTITPYESYKNGELIALADNECLRQIRKIINHPYNSETLKKLKLAKRIYQRQVNTQDNRLKLRDINGAIEKQLFIGEIIQVQTPQKSRYSEIGKNGFCVNNKKYVRLMCGASHTRTNRALFCEENLYNELDKYLRCGCEDKEIILAKWNAYYALSSSATHRVTRPRVCVVTDKEIEMTKTVDWVSENDFQDTIERCEKTLKFNLWDGMGLVSPQMAEIWANDLGLNYIPSEFCIRNAFIKGMVCVFDFHKFGEEIADNIEITDIYGKKYSHRDIDLILTESQFKLWRHYKSWQYYEKINIELDWSWGVSKIAPPKDNDYIRANYQFLQVLDLTDNDIIELCKPTIDWFNGVCGGDIDKMLLYLLGKNADRDNVVMAWNNLQDNFVKSLIAENSLSEDTYIRNRIVNSINKKIRQSYDGKLILNGNFQFLVADPYALCEHTFGLEVKGLLKEHEHYSCYWNRKNVSEVIAMRSPLTWRSEVNKLNLQNTKEQNDWYKYIYSGIIENIWGIDNMLFSGADEDGDIIATTDNKAILKGRCK